MALDLSNLKPYKSLVLGRMRNPPRPGKKGIRTPKLPAVVDSLVADMKGDLRKHYGARTLITAGKAQTVQGLTTAYLRYKEKRVSRWTSNPKIKDTINHLLLVCARRNLVAIYASDLWLRNRVLKRLYPSKKTPGFKDILPVPADELTDTFADGVTRTLWLAGTHRKVSVKADSKVLVGSDLRDALDPLDDYTYYFSSARCLCEKIGTVGTSPRRSSVWTGMSLDWGDFLGTVKKVFDRLELGIEPEEEPLSILAAPCTEAEGVKGAYDVSLQPPELLSDDPSIDRSRLEEMERWAYGADFDVNGTPGTDFDAAVSLNGIPLGTVEIKLDLTDPMHVAIDSEGKAASKKAESDHEYLLRVCSNPRWLKVRYDSGHVLSDGGIFRERPSMVPFEQFKWVSFENFDVRKEKPDTLDLVGQQKSLFDWMYTYWPNLDRSKNRSGGWLVCDDRPMELADFIHLDLKTGKVPVLTMVHVKAAGSKAGPRRGVSVSKYEVVTAQALKNLKFLDCGEMCKGLEHQQDKKDIQRVWHERRPAAKSEMISNLKSLGTNYQRHVVIVQPHLRKVKHDKVRGEPDGLDSYRLRQLDTLLLSAQAKCRDFGAEFSVICSI